MCREKEEKVSKVGTRQSGDEQGTIFSGTEMFFAETFNMFPQQVGLEFLVNFSVPSQLKELFCRPVNTTVELAIHY